uniref:Uncharacterized protein n=1 Tax=Anguilla anguilla TaxID=7936 RepID=A0A0E9RX09_ANGAN
MTFCRAGELNSNIQRTLSQKFICVRTCLIVEDDEVYY